MARRTRLPRDAKRAHDTLRERYYEAVRGIAAELVEALDASGKQGEEARDFLYEEIEEYVGGSGCPDRFPFGDPVALKVSSRVAEGLLDGDAYWEDCEGEEETRRKVWSVVRYDVFQEVVRLRPALM